jgi:hypothetical protein
MVPIVRNEAAHIVPMLAGLNCLRKAPSSVNRSAQVPWSLPSTMCWCVAISFDSAMKSSDEISFNVISLSLFHLDFEIVGSV